MKGRTVSPGPDPNFPFLDEYQRFEFPSPLQTEDDIVAIGGNLSPGMLLSAYEQGIFPWYNPEDPIIWQSPEPRFIIFPSTLHISQSRRKVLRKGEYEIALDRDFEAVIRGCAEIYRPGQGGTWITSDIIDGYLAMHRLGYEHSAEAYYGGELAGGLYGMRLGTCFFGESMFARRANASKAAFLTLARLLFDDGVTFIDCQAHTGHLASLGGVEIRRKKFLRLLRLNLGSRDYEWDHRGNWGERYRNLRVP
ncbi:MAG: leucyl/phenylalanyl-tRNA--protein transferase [Treponema sp.]|jgi:leucyl/phenylalanyl-tRNA--protein transferase|nr:leucyl/phenylalanyl-tRNA--protein transferase [Treponema sp.]